MRAARRGLSGGSSVGTPPVSVLPLGAAGMLPPARAEGPGADRAVPSAGRDGRRERGRETEGGAAPRRTHRPSPGAAAAATRRRSGGTQRPLGRGGRPRTGRQRRPGPPAGAVRCGAERSSAGVTLAEARPAVPPVRGATAVRRELTAPRAPCLWGEPVVEGIGARGCVLSLSRADASGCGEN